MLAVLPMHLVLLREAEAVVEGVRRRPWGPSRQVAAVVAAGEVAEEVEVVEEPCLLGLAAAEGVAASGARALPVSAS